MQFGLLRPIQTLFIVETAMNQLLEVGVPRVRTMLQTLDNIECRLLNAQSRLAAAALGELKIERQQEQEPEMLEHEYDRWARRLSNQLGAPLYAYADRFRGHQHGNGSIPVRGT